jgi:hypothetical protein
MCVWRFNVFFNFILFFYREGGSRIFCLINLFEKYF